PAASSPASTAAATLRAGDSGPDVARLQQLLFQQGFTYVRITGVYDKATVRGVRQFQRDRSLTADPYGVYGPATRAALEG
ncbi:peptidoglycan-binding domain-containing protein, partial [Streptacidiphilus monticola]